MNRKKGHSTEINKELNEWVKETKKEIDQTETNEFSNKKPTGFCEICKDKKATSVCIKCGRNVCKSCYFKLINVCKKCVPKEIGGKWDGSVPDWEEKLGVEWVE